MFGMNKFMNIGPFDRAKWLARMEADRKDKENARIRSIQTVPVGVMLSNYGNHDGKLRKLHFGGSTFKSSLKKIKAGEDIGVSTVFAVYTELRGWEHVKEFDVLAGRITTTSLTNLSVLYVEQTIISVPSIERMFSSRVKNLLKWVGYKEQK